MQCSTVQPPASFCPGKVSVRWAVRRTHGNYRRTSWAHSSTYPPCRATNISAGDHETSRSLTYPLGWPKTKSTHVITWKQQRTFIEQLLSAQQQQEAAAASVDAVTSDNSAGPGLAASASSFTAVVVVLQSEVYTRCVAMFAPSPCYRLRAVVPVFSSFTAPSNVWDTADQRDVDVRTIDAPDCWPRTKGRKALIVNCSIESEKEHVLIDCGACNGVALLLSCALRHVLISARKQEANLLNRW